ncbi:hypothetical protein [Cellulophaga sp. Z1A5H]|uniref:hypothetical protein n=1 Tax=Cellulophaga sp. Z1A5H TaxID=2687291 RepID=UPI0013FDA80B|nr:hypothetical protein [Cellulophaga sp. Z1A5H]
MNLKKISLLLFLAAAFTFMSCSTEDTETTEVALRTKVYTLNSADNAAISGTATFTEKEDGTTTILLSLTNSNNDIHPAFIYLDDVSSTGAVAITLAPIECNCEESTTEVSMLDNGTPITFSELLFFDGNIRVHQSASDLETVIAEGNVGINAINEEAK